MLEFAALVQISRRTVPAILGRVLSAGVTKSGIWSNSRVAQCLETPWRDGGLTDGVQIIAVSGAAALDLEMEGQVKLDRA